MPSIIELFVRTHKGQVQAAQHAKRTVKLSYEEIKEDEYSACERCISAIYGHVNHPALRAALKRASVDELKKFEQRTGYAHVARKGSFTEPSFIRSGRVGEGEEFFTDEQKAFIEASLENEGVPLDGTVPSA